MTFKYSRCFSRQWILLCLAFLAHAEPELVLTNQNALSFNCVVTEFQEIAVERCQEYALGSQPASGGTEQIEVTVCSVETANPDNKEYLIYTSYPGLPILLCRDNEQREDFQPEAQPEAPVLNITVTNEPADDSDTGLSVVSGGGYGSDFFDDWRPGKPGGAGKGTAPFMLETVSAGLLPAGLISFAFDLELPELSNSAPTAFQQRLMSDNREILVVVSGAGQILYQRASMFSRWQRVGQTDTKAISSAEREETAVGGGKDDFIGEDKLTRALASVFAWEYGQCTEISGVLVCPKTGEKRPTAQDLPVPTAINRSRQQRRGSNQVQRHHKGRQSSDKKGQGGGGSSAQHDHQGVSCPHRDCWPARCRCIQCQASGQALSIEQALLHVGNSKYWLLGVLLGVPYNRLNQINTHPASQMEEMLKLAKDLGLLTKGRFVMALSYQNCAFAEEVADQLKVPFSKAKPDCYSVNTRPNIDDPMSLRDALLITNGIETIYMAVEMGLSFQNRQAIETEGDYTKRVLKLLGRLEEQGLLTYGRFLSAWRCFDYASALRASEKLMLKLLPRQPNYQVFPGDRVKALSQPISLRDLARLVPPAVSVEAVALGLGCSVVLIDIPRHVHGVGKRMLILLSLCMEHKGGKIVINEVIHMFYHPELNLWQKAHRLVETLTGQSPDRECLEMADVLDLTYVENLEMFGLALGIPANLITPILHQHEYGLIDVIAVATQLDRLTPENLVYALEQSGNADRITTIEQLIGVTGQALPEEAPVYLSEEESGQPSVGAVTVEGRSVPLTLENSGSLPLSHNWYWIGLAMGLPNYRLEIIEANNSNPVDSLYDMLKVLIKSKYETGHLYDVLLFLNDKDAIQAFPAHLKGEPEQALATLAPLSSMAHALITLAEALHDSGFDFGVKLGVPVPRIKVVLQNCRFDLQQGIIQLIHEKMKLTTISRTELLDELITAVTFLDKPELKSSMMDAMYRLRRKANHQAPGFSNLLTKEGEQEFKKQIRTAVLGCLDVPHEFICPITLELAEDPVVLIMGNKKQVFERSVLTKWIEEHERHPLTNEELKLSEVQECPEIREKIQQWLSAPAEQSGQ